MWLADLAPLGDPATIISAVAAVLGVALRGSDAPAVTIAAAIGDRKVLLILDNCEHLLAELGPLVGELLERAAGLSIIATSQESLGGLAEEHVYRVQPLDLPPADATAAGPGSAGRIAPYGAIAFFAERAAAADDRFSFGDRNAAGIAEICRRLDGLPLALEIAATFVPLLGIEGLRGQLNARLALLSTRNLTTDRRHLGLRDMLGWSYDLLDAEQQALFCRLGIFPGSFSAMAAIAGPEDAEFEPVLGQLCRLVDKSLVMIEGGEQPRYRLLETPRLYALDKLRLSGERPPVADRHAGYYRDLGARADAEWNVTPDSAWLAAYGPEIDNVRAALDWTLGTRLRAGVAVALAGTTDRLWVRLSLVPEGRRYIGRVLKLVDDETPLLDAARLFKCAGILARGNDRQQAVALLERSAALYRELGEREKLGSVLGAIGGNFVYLGRHPEARVVLEEARTILSESDEIKPLFSVLNELGSLAALMKETDEARRCYAVALDLARTLEDVVRENIALINLGELEYGLGASERAIECVREAASSLRAAGQIFHLAPALVNLASYSILHDDLREARTCVEEALSLLREESGRWLRLCLQVLALVAALDGKFVEAAKLIGRVDAGYKRSGEIREPTEQQIRSLLATILAANLTAENARIWAAEGGAWSDSHAVDFAMRRIVSR